MAAVISARDTQLDRDVALKILPREMADDPEIVRRFHQEARAAARLDHENIARVFFCGEDQGLHFIAFELVQGENLRTVLEQRGRLPAPEAIGYTLQIAAGLAHAAARGVVHRDIKPSNMIITPTGRAKLVDMGLARSLGPQNEGHLTQSGVTLGTFDYISPEQALEPRDADVRSDIYSLGCTLYHMLTGQPPVPEGTAAKKLHHHQHVDPLDPRQLNPEVPDEVAALLARMMAKKPEQRYERPEDLVRHLYVVAQKLGSPTEVSDSVLLANSPLPSPRQANPILLTVASVVSLIVLILILTPTPHPAVPAGPGPTADNTTTNPAPSDKAPAPAVTPTATQNSDKPLRTAAPPATPVVVDHARQLADLLQKQKNVRVRLKKDLKLSREEPLVFDGQELVIEPDDSLRGKRPTLRLDYDLMPPGDEPWAALLVRGGKVRIRGVRFELNAHEADIIMSAVAVQNGHVTLEECEFVQDEPFDPDQGRVSSVSVAGDGEGVPEMNVQRCYFARGQRVLSVTGEASVGFRDCAFAPQTVALCDVSKENGQRNDSAVDLVSCSAFISAGAVFQLSKGVPCRLEVKNCVFSHPDADLMMAENRSTLIQQTGSLPPQFHYHGSRNCYHNLQNFFARSSGTELRDTVTSLDLFRHRYDVVEDHSLELSDSPWQNPAPLTLLRERPRHAFQLKTSLPEVRQEDGTRMLGVERTVWGPLYDKLPPLTPRKPPETVVRQGQRIVDPSIPVTNAQASVYRTLQEALVNAQRDDEILLKWEGVQAIEPLRLEKAGLNVTLKPYRRFHPVLTLGPTTEPDAALFRIHDGRLKLERLEFRLAPERSGFRAQAVVAVMGDGQCTFQDCVITLEDPRRASLSVVTLADPSAVMHMGPQAGQPEDPRIDLDNCLVRGSGSLVGVRASRPFALAVQNSLLALDGSLLAVDGNTSDTTYGDRSQSLSLKKCTAYLNDYLVWLRAAKDDTRTMKGLVRTQVSPVANCLFVAGGGKALIHLDGVDNDDQMRRLVSWDDSHDNDYSNFTQYLDQQSYSESSMMPPPPYGKVQWEDFAQERNSKYEKVRLSNLPTDLAKTAPSDFKVRPDASLPTCGADLDRLPKPFDESGAAARSASD
jgi:serine/threonine protein kinase